MQQCLVTYTPAQIYYAQPTPTGHTGKPTLWIRVYWIASWYGQAVHPSLKREAKTDRFLDIFQGKRGNSCNEGQDGRQQWLGIVWKSAKVQDDLLRESTRVAQALERKNTIVTDDGLAIGRWRFDPRQKRRRIFLLQILLVLNLSRSTC